MNNPYIFKIILGYCDPDVLVALLPLGLKSVVNEIGNRIISNTSWKHQLDEPPNEPSPRCPWRLHSAYFGKFEFNYTLCDHFNDMGELQRSDMLYEYRFYKTDNRPYFLNVSSYESYYIK